MNNAPSPVLVIGATGFLGGQVVDALLTHGKSVRAMVRPSSNAAALERKACRLSAATGSTGPPSRRR